MAIAPIGPNAIPGTGETARPRQAEGAAQGAGFAETLEKLIDNVQQTNETANAAVGDMLAGTGEVHQAMIALHEAEESLEIAVTLKNKFVQAYQEIMKMGM